MAVTIESSPQHTPPEGTRNFPIDKHGKFRMAYFKFTQGAAAGDAGSEANLVKLPQGRIRILPSQSRFTSAAFGAARTLDIGLRAYTKSDSKTVEAEDPDALTPAGPIDVSGALANNAFDPLLKFDIFSHGGAEVFATVAGGTIPAGTVVEGFVAYMHE